MSGIAVIRNLDGRPVDSKLITRMLDAIAHRAIDGRGAWLNDDVALGHAAMHTTPEDVQQQQPYRVCVGADEMCIVLDGRVDNRTELQAALAAAGAAPREDTDIELILRAWLCWGQDSPRRIIGDFVFAIWDSRYRSLFCARDTGGIRPLYYFYDRRLLVCGSELQQLFQLPAVPREPNQAAIADYLCASFNGPDETIFRHILRLPPAHYLVADSRGVTVGRYYDLDPEATIRYTTDEQYADHFLTVFKEAVHCRLRARAAVAAELSGGLDSSSVVVTALALQRGERAPTPLETFSIVYDEPESDERRYVQEVASATGVRCNVVCPTLIDYDKCVQQVRRYADLPDYVNGAVFDGLRQEIVRRGIRVVLTGLGGDQWLQGSEYYLCDLVARLKFRELWRQLHSDHRFGKLDTFSKKLLVTLRWGLKPLLPKPIIRALKETLLGRRQYPNSIEGSFARAIHLAERMDTEPSRPPRITYAQRSIYDAWVSAWLSHLLEMDDRSNAWAGVEGRHPFYDRRVIEFAFAIPEEQRARLDLTKFVLRQAMKGLLPELVRERRTKSQFGRVFVETFAKIGGERLFENMTMESRGWVSAQRMRQLCRDRLARYPTNLWPLWTTFAAELWFREVFASHHGDSSRDSVRYGNGLSAQG